MYYVYILQNTLSGRHYIGSTNDLARRIAEHNRGQTTSTRQRGSWQVRFSEKYVLKKDAVHRERQIKAYKGGHAFKNLLVDEKNSTQVFGNAGIAQW